MKIYNTKKDKYGWPIDGYKYLKDRGVSRAGGKVELLVEMRVWNVVAGIVNSLKNLN